MALPVVFGAGLNPTTSECLNIHAPTVQTWLVDFLRYECVRKRRVHKAVLGLSGGLDSATVAFLAALAFGPESVLAVRMPYKVSSAESLDHAQLVIDELGIQSKTVDITAMVDGFANSETGITPARIGNVCARCRMAILFDQSAAWNALPIGTGNKTERLFGYFTWHGDDAPPINPLGDLFKTQVLQLAEHMGLPRAIIDKPPTADLIKGQTDEGDLGITYARADRILHYLTSGYSQDKLVEIGFPAAEVDLVWKKVAGTHWKRRLPTVAMLATSAIGEYYLRPVDY